MKKWILCIGLIIFLALPWKYPFQVHAQATTSYTKINTTPVPGLTYDDTSNCPIGNACTYEITSLAGTLEGPKSAPSLAVQTTFALPHALISWTASTSTGVTGYNVYVATQAPPNPPTAPAAVLSSN